MCKHETEYLMGVAGGVICRKCGQRFDHIPKQAPAKVEAPVKEAPKAEEKPKKAPAKKPAARKGAKANG